MWLDYARFPLRGGGQLRGLVFSAFGHSCLSPFGPSPAATREAGLNPADLSHRLLEPIKPRSRSIRFRRRSILQFNVGLLRPAPDVHFGALTSPIGASPISSAGW